MNIVISQLKKQENELNMMIEACLEDIENLRENIERYEDKIEEYRGRKAEVCRAIELLGVDNAS